MTKNNLTMRQSRTQGGHRDGFVTHGVQVNSNREERSLIVTVASEQGSSTYRQSFVVDWQMQLAEQKEFDEAAKAETKFGLFFH